MVHRGFSSWSNKVFLTRQELLSPGQKKRTVVQNSVKREETVAPVSLKDFALENFRYNHHMTLFKILKIDAKVLMRKLLEKGVDFPVTGRQGADTVPTKVRDCGLVPETFSDNRC